MTEIAAGLGLTRARGVRSGFFGFATLSISSHRTTSDRMHRTLARSSRALRSSPIASTSTATVSSNRFALASSAVQRRAALAPHSRGLATATDKAEAQVQT